MNSLKEDNLNLAAPDVWNDSIMTTFFPEQIPQVSPAAAARGCCLSADDMLAIRDLVHQVSWYTVVFDNFFCCLLEVLLIPQHLGTVHRNLKHILPHKIKFGSFGVHFYQEIF